MKKERVFVYIDGGNFYRKISKNYNYHYLSFKLAEFFDHLVGSEREKIGTRYYIGKVKQETGNPKSIELYNSQQKLFQKLKNEKIYTVLGQILHIGNTYKEKGVDVKLALNLLEGAYEDRYDTALVVSSDSDLAPAFEMVKRKGKKIECIMFDQGSSFALQKNSTTFRILNDHDLRKFGDKR